MALDILAEIENEQKRAAAKASGGNASFFVLKDGEKALVRPLLNLNAIALIQKHDFYNQSTGKYEVNALCAQSLDLDESFCVHCVKAKESNNKKLLPVKLFVIPAYVYGIKNAAGQAITYTDQEGNEKPVNGVRYLMLKASSDILGVLTEMYREGTNLTTLDLTISRKGERLDTKYTVLPRAASPFTVENVPAQTADGIIDRINELNPASLIENPGQHDDPFPDLPPAQANKPAKSTVPDF